MEHLNRLLICVKDPARDLDMILHADLVSRAQTDGRQFHFLHVQETDGEGGAVAGAAPLTLNDLQAEVSARITTEGPVADVVCSVVTGSALIEILRYVIENDIDCLLVGCGVHARPRGTDRAVLARRLARKATCSVLTVPQGSPGRITRVVVPVRDTLCSVRATQLACQVASGARANVSCLNVFQMGSGYSKAGSSLEEHIARLRVVAEHEALRMLVRVETGGVQPQVRCIPDPYSEPVSLILEECEKAEADLIVIGSRGRTGAAGVLLGKVTEELIAECKLPVLAVKRKGEQIGVVQALLLLA